MTPTDPLAHLARAYHRSIALRWWATVLAMPVLVPLILERGLDLAQLGLVMATYSAVTAVAEVPTGGLADAFGRVRTTIVADVLAIASRVLFLMAPDLTGFLAAAALGGFARALGSGALEAWYVDARRLQAPTADLQAPLARAGTIAALAIGSGSLMGGFVPLAGPWLGLGAATDAPALALGFAASAVFGVAALGATLVLRDADAGPLGGRAAARPDRVFRGAWSALRAAPTLIALAAVAGLTGGLVLGYEMLFPTELAARWGDAATPVLGFAFAGAFAASAAGQTLGGRARGGTARTAALGYGMVALATAGLVPVVPGPWGVAAAIAAFWAAYGALGFAGPALATAFHHRAPSDRRAVLLSVQSLASFAGGVAASLTLGAVATVWGPGAAWTAVAAVATVLAVVLAVVGVATRRRVRAPAAP
ncbi:MAG: MFS transporter [Trueperaceae bacterium]